LINRLKHKMYTNIPLPNSINTEFLGKTPDEDLIWVILGYIAKEFKDGENPDDLFNRLPKDYELVSYTLNVLNAQISNGGFNQFFYNGYENSIPKLPEYLSTFKAYKHKHIFEKAITIYNEEKQNLELQNLHSKRTLEAFSVSYKLTHLNDLDDEWCDLEQELFNLINKYIRENSDIFVTKNN
jgi:hypothetical protein